MITLAATLGALIIASPMLLDIVNDIYGVDWERLGNIGQAYGGISSVLSAFAILGVAASLLIQSRQIRLQQQQVARGMQFELIKIANYDDEIRAILPPAANMSESTLWRRNVYLNMWFMYNFSAYVTGGMSREELRRQSSLYFQRAEIRDWWKGARWAYEIGSQGRREVEFVRIVDEEYDRITARLGRARAKSAEVGKPGIRTHNASPRILFTGCIAAIGVATITAAIRKGRRMGRWPRLEPSRIHHESK